MYLLCTESLFESDLFSRKREKIAQNVAVNGNFSIFWKQRIFFKLMTKKSSVFVARKNENFILKIKKMSSLKSEISVTGFMISRFQTR